MIAPARIAALNSLIRIEMRAEHSDDVLHSANAADLDSRDQNLHMEIVYGTLRWRAWLDAILCETISRSWESVQPKARVLLEFSLYQMARMDRVPDRAVIHDAVELAKTHLRPGGAGFVNGVLRTLGRQRPWTKPDFHKDLPVWTQASLPKWLWQRWENRFGMERAFEYALSLNQPLHAAFRISAEGDAPHPAGARLSDLVPGAWISTQSMTREERETLHLQDEASQLVPHLPGDICGQILWDVCASPGGKNAIFIERTGSNGKVISSDLSENRARALRDLWGGHPEVVVADARQGAPFRFFFDGVAVDVPCSGLGTLRRNPEIKWRMQAEKLKEYGDRQKRMLQSAAQVVRPEGWLLYSTCSTEPEENEDVVRDFLAANPEFYLARPEYPAGIEAWLDEEGFFRSYPGPRLWDGFFAALLLRERGRLGRKGVSPAVTEA
jgi:16S rRNA (cytosine967-C5)-methyltransferase